MTETLFNPNEQPVVIDETALLDKYSKMTPEDLIKKALNADLHITKIEAENKTLRDHSSTLRDQVGEKVNREQFLSELKSIVTPPKPDAPIVPQPEKDKGLTKEDVENLLATAETRRQARDNIAQVKLELVKQYGPGYAEKVAAKAEELGYTRSEFDQLAAAKPTAFLKLVIGEKTTEPHLRQPTSTVNTSNFQSSQGLKNKKYFDDLRQKSPSTYASIETQNELLAEAIRQGDAFYN